jgi:hypothetical protein
MDLIPICPSCKVHITSKPTGLTQRASYGNPVTANTNTRANLPATDAPTSRALFNGINHALPSDIHHVQLTPAPCRNPHDLLQQPQPPPPPSKWPPTPRRSQPNTLFVPTTAWDLLMRKNDTVSDMPTSSGTRQLGTPYRLAPAGGRTTSNSQPVFILGVGNEPPPVIPHHALHLQPHVPFPNPSDPSPRDDLEAQRQPAVRCAHICT